MAVINKIKLPNGTELDLRDRGLRNFLNPIEYTISFQISTSSQLKTAIEQLLSSGNLVNPGLQSVIFIYNATRQGVLFLNSASETQLYGRGYYVGYYLSDPVVVSVDNGTVAVKILATTNYVDSTAVLKSSVVNNLTTTDEGYVLDARQGKTLKDAVDGKAKITSGTFTTPSVVGTRVVNGNYSGTLPTSMNTFFTVRQCSDANGIFSLYFEGSVNSIRLSSNVANNSVTVKWFTIS